MNNSVEFSFLLPEINIPFLPNNSTHTNSQKPFLNFFIERYNDAYNIQLKELISLHKNKIKSRSTFEDVYLALKLANAAYKSLKLKKTIKV